MARARHFYITYGGLRIKVIVSSNNNSNNNNINDTYTLLFPDESTCVIEKNAAGWRRAEHQEPHWADKDMAAIGEMLDKKLL